MVVRGAGIDDHVAPPSVVLAIAGHGVPLHGTPPRTHPWSAETKVAETGSKPAGTAAPCGFGDALALGDAAADADVGDGTGDADVGDETGDAEVDGEAPTDGPDGGRTTMASRAIAMPAARSPKSEPNLPVATLRRIPLVSVAGSRAGICDTRATRRSGAGWLARPSSVARRSRSNCSSVIG
jgi:hypothetical protein